MIDKKISNITLYILRSAYTNMLLTNRKTIVLHITGLKMTEPTVGLQKNDETDK